MNNRIITISREFGSGGRTIGRRTAAELGLPCYDAELIEKLEEATGLSRDYIAERGEYAAMAVGCPVLSRTGISTGIPFKTTCGVFSGRLFWNWQGMGHA